jgi:hypothetical protein
VISIHPIKICEADVNRVCIALLALPVVLSACAREKPAPVAATVSPFILTASIQDIMHGVVDPSADYLWESVGTEVTKAGETVHQPSTDAEWDAVRNRAITLLEATNLLVMDGRRVVAEGKEVEDAHVDGIQKASEIQAAIDKDRASWIGYAHALHSAGEQALQAADTRDADKLLHSGEALDEVCEACHLKYWYPGQVIPKI